MPSSSPRKPTLLTPATDVRAPDQTALFSKPGVLERLFFATLHRTIVAGIVTAGATALLAIPDALQMLNTASRVMP